MLKKGELTSTQIIGIILVIAGFVVILLFIPSIMEVFGSGGDNRELCKLSVISRAATASGAQQAIPLRCSTERVCISKSGGSDSCTQFAGESVRSSVRLDGDVEKDKDIIEKEIGDGMVEWWDQSQVAMPCQSLGGLVPCPLVPISSFTPSSRLRPALESHAR